MSRVWEAVGETDIFSQWVYCEMLEIDACYWNGGLNRRKGSTGLWLV